MSVFTGVNSYVYAGYADTGSAFTDQPCTIVTGRTLAYITNRVMRAWDPNEPVTITYTGGTYSGTATVIRAGGYIKFDPALGAGITVKVTGKYIPIAEVCLAKSFSIDLTWNTEDATRIPCTTTADDAGWQKNAATVKSCSGTVELFQDNTVDENDWRNAILGNGSTVTGGEILYLELGMTTSWTLHVLAWPSLNINASASALNTETINFTVGDDPPFLY